MGNQIANYERPKVTESYVERILREKYGTDKVKCTDLSLNAGSEKGDNYVGEILSIDVKAKIDEKEKEFHWVAKLMPDNGARISFTRSAKIFEKEIYVYSDLFERFKNLERCFRGPTGSEFVTVPRHCPFVYGDPAPDREILLMENMRHLGFQDSPQKKTGLDLDHCLLVAEWLGKFHGTSYAFVKRFPGGIGRCMETLPYLEDRFFVTPDESQVRIITSTWESSMESILGQIKEAQDDGEDYDKKIFEAMKPFGTYFEMFKNILKPCSHFNVICHGDPWFNNIFFKYDDGKPVDIIMFDLQVVRYSNPCNDLAYFFFASVDNAGRKNFSEKFLQRYHDTLVKTLGFYGHSGDVYAFEQLEKDFKDAKLWGTFFALQGLPSVLVEKDQAFDMDNMKELSEEAMKELFEKDKERIKMIFKENKYVKERLFGILKELKNDGIL